MTALQTRWMASFRVIRNPKWRPPEAKSYRCANEIGPAHSYPLGRLTLLNPYSK